MGPRSASTRQKIVGRQALRRRIARVQSRGKKIVFTSGCYDVLHVGHLRSFEQARGLGDALVVGINRDQRVRELKGRGRPLVPERQRAELVAGLACVDYVVFFSEDDASATIRALKPDIVCKGGEYRGKPVPEQDMIESLGGRFFFLRQVPRIRTSLLLERVRR